MIKQSILAVAAVATLGSTAAFAASDAVFTSALQDAATYVDIELVTASSDAVVEIYDYRLGETGALLGTSTVHAGANDDLRVQLDHAPLGDVLAVVKSGGVVLSENVIAIDIN